MADHLIHDDDDDLLIDGDAMHGRPMPLSRQQKIAKASYYLNTGQLNPIQRQVERERKAEAKRKRLAREAKDKRQRHEDYTDYKLGVPTAEGNTYKPRKATTKHLCVGFEGYKSRSKRKLRAEIDSLSRQQERIDQWDETHGKPIRDFIQDERDVPYAGQKPMGRKVNNLRDLAEVLDTA